MSITAVVLEPGLTKDTYRLSEEAVTIGNTLFLQVFDEQSKPGSETVELPKEDVIAIGVILHQLAGVVRQWKDN